MRALPIFGGLILLALPGRAESESSYEQAWAALHGGTCNVRLDGGSQVDVLTATHAVDVVFAPRWQDAIGQSLNHAMSAEKRAGIVLIVKKEREFECAERLRLMIDLFNLPIDIWTVGLSPERGPAP